MLKNFFQVMLTQPSVIPMDCGLQILTATCVPLLPQILYKMCDTQQCDLFIVTSVYYIPIGAPSVKQNQNTPDPLSAIIISLVILYVLSSTLFCFIGSICGWVGHKHKASKSINDSQSTPILVTMSMCNHHSHA